MRIDGFNKISQVYQNSRTTKTQGTQAAADSRDILSISQTGTDYQIAKNAIKETSDIRKDLVNELKQKVDSGTYSVSTDDFASKLLAKFNELQS
ncbi:MAG: flagellar biosynthesis anti-sigma factor FlgM [Lachnospiraceae bacterium]